MWALRVKLLAYHVPFLLRRVAPLQIVRRHSMVQAIPVAVDSRPPSPRVLTPVARVPVEPFSADVIRLLDVLARIELRRQARLRALQEREAS
jgi:hypothetical protein